MRPRACQRLINKITQGNCHSVVSLGKNLYFPLQAAGLALFALAIWVAVDPYKLYPIAAVSGKDDIFAAAWIAIFTGFAYFCTAIFGIYAALKRKRSLMLLVCFWYQPLKKSVFFMINLQTYLNIYVYVYCSSVPDPHVHHLHLRMCVLHHSSHQQRLRKCTGAAHCNMSVINYLSV